MRIRSPSFRIRASYEVAFSPDEDEARDPYFGLPLSLQTPCVGNILWAWNEAHRTFLENYVAAALRERIPNPCPPDVSM
jgi:hypothetical protein